MTGLKRRLARSGAAPNKITPKERGPSTEQLPAGEFSLPYSRRKI